MSRGEATAAVAEERINANRRRGERLGNENGKARKRNRRDSTKESRRFLVDGKRVA